MVQRLLTKGLMTVGFTATSLFTVQGASLAASSEPVQGNTLEEPSEECENQGILGFLNLGGDEGSGNDGSGDEGSGNEQCENQDLLSSLGLGSGDDDQSDRNPDEGSERESGEAPREQH